MKGRHLHVLAKQIAGRYPDRISKDFEKNKDLVRELNILPSGEERNKLAGELCTIAGKAVKNAA